MYARVEAGLQSRSSVKQGVKDDDSGFSSMQQLEPPKLLIPDASDERAPAIGALTMDEKEIEDMPGEELEPTISSDEEGSGHSIDVGIDPEVQRALDVLDRMIKLVQSRKLGSHPEIGATRSAVELPERSDAVQSTSSEAAAPHVIREDKAVLERAVDDHRTEPEMAEVVAIRRKNRWFCFGSSTTSCL
jgi:hypothetical protein